MLNYMKSSCTVDMIIAPRYSSADQHIITENFLFTETTHAILSRIYYTQDSIRNIIFGDYHSTCQSRSRRTSMCALSDLSLCYYRKYLQLCCVVSITKGVRKMVAPSGDSL